MAYSDIFILQRLQEVDACLESRYLETVNRLKLNMFKYLLKDSSSINWSFLEDLKLSYSDLFRFDAEDGLASKKFNLFLQKQASFFDTEGEGGLLLFFIKKDLPELFRHALAHKIAMERVSLKTIESFLWPTHSVRQIEDDLVSGVKPSRIACLSQGDDEYLEIFREIYEEILGPRTKFFTDVHVAESVVEPPELSILNQTHAPNSLSLVRVSSLDKVSAGTASPFSCLHLSPVSTGSLEECDYTPTPTRPVEFGS